MSLLKLPLLLVSSISWHVTLWYPPEPETGEQVAATSFRERMWKHAGLPCNLFLRGTTWLVTVAESAVIIHARLHNTSWSPSPSVSAALDALGPADASRLTTSFAVGTLLVTMGGIIRILSFRALGPMFTFEQCILKEHRLVTTGPYAVVRHPSYTGLLVGIVGSCVLLGSPGAWLCASGVLSSTPFVRPVLVSSWWAIMAASCVTLFRRTTDEDHMLKEAFGKEWERWAGRVRYKLVPFVY